MKEEALYNSFLEKIIQRFPHKTELVSTLTDLLCIGKEAVYRRLRGEVSFTFYEAMTISEKFNIPLNHLDIENTSMAKPFRLNLTEYIDPAESDFALLEEMTGILKSFHGSPELRAGEITNILPQPLYAEYDCIAHFLLFKWCYQSNKSYGAIHYRDITVTEKLRRKQSEYARWAKRLHTEYVFDKQLLHHLVGNVRYFYNIGLVTPQEVQQIKENLLQIVDDIDYLSRTGTFRETGKKVDIYISELNIDTNYIYISAPGHQLTIVKAFLLNGIASTDRASFEEVLRWMRSIKQQSISITSSGEKERIEFLNEQLAVIARLDGM